jgi:alcohol dehydrogenase class IV
MRQPFVHQAAAQRVVFGAGTLARLPDELDRLHVRRALVLCTPGQRAGAERVAALLGQRAAGIFDRAAMHVPIETAQAACEMARELDADCAVAIGGGSTTGLAKAIALVAGKGSGPGLPIVAVPTTYAGSEMTPIYGLTEGGLKRTGRDERVRPRCVIYDPELSRGLPLPTTVTSAFNAIAHAAEGLYAPDGNPLVALMAEEGIRASAAALTALQRDPRDLDARGDALYGAWLCGSVLGAITMGLHHKLCHTLGGSFELPHAEVHTVVLPHALAYNAAAAPGAMARIARALAAADAAQGLFALAQRLGAPRSLAALGMPAGGLERAAELAVSSPYPNPRPLERAALRALLQRAFDGAPPQP